MPMLFSEDSSARPTAEPRVDPATVAATAPAAVWLRNFRRVSLFAGESLFIECFLSFFRLHWNFELCFRRILWTTRPCFEYSTRRNCPREEVRRVSRGVHL